MKELKNNIDKIKTLCNLRCVKSLFAFGSVVYGNLGNDSEIDLVVDIESSDPLEHTHNYLSLNFQLEDVFEKRIDLLEDRAVKNPYLKKQIDNTKGLIYRR